MVPALRARGAATPRSSRATSSRRAATSSCTEEDFEKVRAESTRVINLVQFADETAIDPMYVDRAYYLAPDGPMAADAFAVMREGMKGKAGIGKVALYGREYLVAVRPQRAAAW